MKYIVIALCLLHLNVFGGKTYYIAASGDNTTGLTPTNAWRNITKLNQNWNLIAAGDSIFFHCGETFRGSIVVISTLSGTASARVTIGSYGTGAKPIISGLYTLDGWVANGTNKWVCNPDSVTKANVNVVTINGQAQPAARTPWLKYYQSVASDANNVTMKSAWINGQDWTGGEVCWRKNTYESFKGPITAQSGPTLTVVNNTQPIYDNRRATWTNGTDSMGMFIQRHINAMDSEGEFFYNKNTNVMNLYTATNPNTQTIKASYLDTLLILSNRPYFTIRNLKFEGAGVYAIEAYGGTGLQIFDCDFDNNTKAIYIWARHDIWITRCTLNNSLQGGIYLRNSGAYRVMVDSNVVTNTGRMFGMGCYNNESGLRGITSLTDTTRSNNFNYVIGNTIINTGNMGMYWQGSNAIIRRNVVDTYADVIDDAGAIYTFNFNTAVTTSIYTNRTVDSNFISNGIGAPLGSRLGTIDVAGMYLDDQVQAVNVFHNTMWNVPGNGIQLNTPKDIWVRDNTVFNCNWMMNQNIREFGSSSNVKTTKNKFYQKGPSFQMWHVNDQLDGPPSITNDQSITNFTFQDSNWITNAQTNSYQATTRRNKTSGYSTTNINEATWKSTYGHDLVSVSPPVTVTPTNVTLWTNRSNSDSIASFPTLKKIAPDGTVWNNAAIVPAWSSLLLIDNGTAANQAPTANAGPDRVVTLPLTTTILNGSGTDPENQTLNYLWTKLGGSPAGGDLSSSTVPNPTVTNLQQGVYQYGLTVTDPGPLSGSDIVLVTVNAPVNNPPTVSAGVDKTVTLPTNTTSLTATATDPEGAGMTYTWTRISGTGTTLTIVSPNALTTSITNLTQGTHDLRFTASDGVNSTSDIATITVLPATPPANIPPVSNAGTNATVYLPQTTYQLNGSGTDADGTINTYAWDFLPGSPSGAYFSNPTIANPQIGGLGLGTYTARLIVTDNSGATGSSNVIITVNPQPANVNPTVNAGLDRTIRLPQDTIIVTAVGADADSDPATLTYYWQRISGAGGISGTVVYIPTSRITTVQFPGGVGSYSLGVTTTDIRSGVASDIMNVTVLPAFIPPVVNAGGPISITLPVDSVLLSGTATDADGTISSILWARASGPASANIISPNSLSTKVKNLTQGTYTFVLTVTDSDGNTRSSTTTVNVSVALPNGYKVKGLIINPNVHFNKLN